MEEYIVKDGKKLRLGYTTGSCAAAAAKAATYMLLTGALKERISLATPQGKILDLDVLEIETRKDSVSCAIKKDGGDDPDVTSGSLIFAEVKYVETPGITIIGGRGVGRVTKPGLDQPVGEAAINSVPRKMIRESVEEIKELSDYEGGLTVTISVPGGEELAKKTFNPKLGIEGGISIIGTTGIVEPMSEQALIETIKIELRQKRMEGDEYVLLVPGNYGVDFVRDELALDVERIIRTSNFIGDSIDTARELGFKGILLVGHIGKLVKLAGGVWNTHSKYGDARMEILSSFAKDCGAPNDVIESVMECVTTDEALRVLDEEGYKEAVLAEWAKTVEAKAIEKAGETEIGIITFSRATGLLAKTSKADELLKILREQA